MGIYPSDIIYGVRIYYSKDGDTVYQNDIIYEKKYESTFNEHHMNELRQFFNGLEDKVKCNLRFCIYTEYTSTLDYVNYRIDNNRSELGWFPVNYRTFCRLFQIQIDDDVAIMYNDIDN
jgi:hypothetical protein